MACHPAEEMPLPALLDELFERTGYLASLRPESEEDQARLENLRELKSAAQAFTEARAFAGGDDDLLTAFLDQVALVSDLDGWQSEKGVTLMTLAQRQGARVTGRLPARPRGRPAAAHQRPGARRGQEEERRLFYVGMTRARERLLLSCCRRRRIAGAYQDQRESPFLAELPEALLEASESPRLYQSERTRGIDEFYGRPRPTAPLPEAPHRGPRRGSRVRHPTLGQGVVLEIDGEGDDAKLTIFFERAGKKKLIARFASLELL